MLLIKLASTIYIHIVTTSPIATKVSDVYDTYIFWGHDKTKQYTVPILLHLITKIQVVFYNNLFVNLDNGQPA